MRQFFSFLTLFFLVFSTCSTSAYSILHNYEKLRPHLNVLQASSSKQQTLQEQEPPHPEGGLMVTDVSFLADKDLKGKYHSQQEDELFNYLTVKEGEMEALLYKDEMTRSTLAIDKFVLILFNPVYHDQKAIRLQLSLDKMEDENRWEGVNQKAQVVEFDKERSINEYNISNLNYSITVKDIKKQDIDKITLELEMKGSNFDFKASLKYNSQVLSTLGYCFYATFTVAIQVLSLFALLRRMEGIAPNVASKLSLTTVAVCNIEDFYLTMMHIEYIMTSASSSYLLYIFPSIAYIALFVVFDMKLLFLVWRAHYMREIDNPQALRKKLTTFYIKFYVGLFAYLTLTYFFSFYAWMVILQNLIMLPQIIHNARVGNNPGFQPLYVFGYLAARFFMPMYERSCPSNHFMVTPMPGLVVSLAILYGLQILVLYLQCKLGPRFFIPKMFQPDYYDYNFKFPNNEENRDTQCSICLQNFFEQHQSTNINSSTLDDPMLKEVNVMKTPCNHYFHKDCLLSWIDVKLECPSCRSQLPPL